MKCPICQENNEVSEVAQFGSSSTLIFTIPYYDKEGNWHVHDPNTTHTSYRCTNGHEFTEVAHRKCPTCGWQIKEDYFRVNSDQARRNRQ